MEASSQKYPNKYGVSLNVDLSELALDIFEMKAELRGLIHNTEQIETILREFVLMAVTRADLDAALRTLNTGINQVIQIHNSIVTTMQQKLEAANAEIANLNVQLNTPLDFSAEMQQITAASEALSKIAPVNPTAPVTPQIVEELVIQEPVPVTPTEPALTSDNMDIVTPAVEPTLIEPVAEPVS